MNKSLLTIMITALFACGGCVQANEHAKENPQANPYLFTTSNPLIRQGYVDGPTGQLHYWTAGTGPDLLLIHQSSASVEEYGGLVPHLAQNFRLIAFDWPGHGQSDNPTDELGVEDFSRSALAVLDHVGAERFHVLGNHGGALIAMHLAWKHPQRVQKLVLSGTSAPKPMAEVEKFAESLDLERRGALALDGEALHETWKRYVEYMPNSSAADIMRTYINSMVKRVRPYDAHYGVLRYNRMQALASIKQRSILLMQGDQDPYVGGQEKLLDMLPNAKRAVIQEAGVFMFYEKPKESALPILKFLTATDG